MVKVTEVFNTDRRFLTWGWLTFYCILVFIKKKSSLFNCLLASVLLWLLLAVVRLDAIM